MRTLRLNMTLVLFALCAAGIGLASDPYEVRAIEQVKAIPMRPEWDRFKILVWQYRTSVLEDIALYRRLGLGGFHIDRGDGKDELVAFSNREHFPYYVDHAADKGVLCDLCGLERLEGAGVRRFFEEGGFYRCSRR